MSSNKVVLLMKIKKTTSAVELQQSKHGIVSTEINYAIQNSSEYLPAFLKGSYISTYIFSYIK